MSVRLALIGKNISHSLSPLLQKEIWGSELEGYDLIDIDDESKLPALEELSQKYLGINVTTPYKTYYFKKVNIESKVAKEIGAINTISLADMSGTNTDAIAVEKILRNYLESLPGLEIHLLGSGVMARMTILIAAKIGINVKQYSRDLLGDITKIDFSMLEKTDLIINSCSRDFAFAGPISSNCHFWDYNYSFESHSYLKTKVKTYQDGRELLLEQARSAAEFWRQKSKLNI